MLRQAILWEDEPPLLSFIVDEAALRRIVGGREVMRAQLTHLVELGSHPTLIIRVLSFEAGAHASPEGGFSIYQMPDPYPDVAHIESRAGALYVEAEGVEPFQAAYDCLIDTALSPDESTAFIDEIARTL